MLKAVPLCRAVQDGILGSPGAGRSRPAEPHSSEVTETGAASSAAKRKGQEKESASQRGQEKTRWGSEHPTQKWEKKKKSGREGFRVCVSHLLTAFSPGDPQAVWDSEDRREFISQGQPHWCHTHVASQLLTPSALPEVTKALHWNE